MLQIDEKEQRQSADDEWRVEPREGGKVDDTQASNNHSSGRKLKTMEEAARQEVCTKPEPEAIPPRYRFIPLSANSNSKSPPASAAPREGQGPPAIVKSPQHNYDYFSQSPELNT